MDRAIAARGRRRRRLVALAAAATAVVVVGCSSGPAPLASLVSPGALDAWDARVAAHGGDAKEAWFAFRAEETGRSIEDLRAADAALPVRRNPFDRDDLRTAQLGAMLYEAYCLECHGANAGGYAEDGRRLDGHKDFHHGHIRGAVDLSAGYVAGWFRRVAEGSVAGDEVEDGTPAEMPAFGELLTREQIWLTVTYLTTKDSVVD